MMWLAAYEECPQAEYTGIALEYGTLPNAGGDGRAARRPVAARSIPRPTTRTRRAIKQQMRDAFYTDTDAWKEQIVEQAVDASYGAVRGLAADNA